MARLLVFIVTVFAGAGLFAAPLTWERITGLPESERAAWQVYFKWSQANALADAAVVRAEVAAHKMTNALRAPSGGDFKLPVELGDIWYAGDEAKQPAQYVWKIEDGIAHKVKVETGLSDDAWQAVGKPLKIGDTVARGPSRQLRQLQEGDRVEQRKDGGGDGEDDDKSAKDGDQDGGPVE